MGIFDSSATRVAPVFDQLLARDPSGAYWLNALLRLPLGRGGDASAAALGEPHLIHHAWGKPEKKLAAPRALLEWLVRNVEAPADLTQLGTGATRKQRERLLARDPEAIAEALRAVERGEERGWAILEGPTFPDVYLETKEALIVVEGKRTEPGLTTHTTWMPARHQMLRHIDAAWDRRGERRVLGLLIVEGDGGAEGVAVPARWVDAVRATVSEEALKGSLPHRSAQERQAISDAFLGVTTWQAVCLELGIAWGALPDRVGATADG